MALEKAESQSLRIKFMRKFSYSYSQVVNVKWALELELSHLDFMRKNNEEVINYLKKRIAELKEEEKQCLKIQTS